MTKKLEEGSGDQVVGTVEPAQGVPLDEVHKLVDTFKETVKDIAATRAPEPALAPRDTEADLRRKQAEAAERYKETKDKANELAAAGDAAGAMEVMYQHILDQSASSTPVPEETAGYKAMYNNAKKLTKFEHKETFEKWGDEIEAEIARMPAEKRVLTDAWEEAIGNVRTRHVDDIIADAVARDRKEHGFDPDTGVFIAPPSRSSNLDPNSPEAKIENMSEDERGVAKSFGISNEDYVKQKELIDSERRRGRYPLIEEKLETDGRDLNIKPGSF